MTEEEAVMVLAPMAIAFDHNDDTVAQWLGKLQRLSDPQAAAQSAEQLVESARHRRVPGWLMFKEAYDRIHLRLEDDRRDQMQALGDGGLSRSRYPSFEEGVKIAWDAYQDECRLRGKAPNREYFDSILSGMNRQARREARQKRARR